MNKGENIKMKNEKFRSLYDDVAMKFDHINTKTNSKGLFVLITNNFAYPFEKITYNKDIKILSNYLNSWICELDRQYVGRREFESIISSEKIVTAFRGYWDDEENSYFYEGVIIEAHKHNTHN